MLVAPGSSLGGARPKANVVDENGRLWIVKFPSAGDTKDSGAWEMVTAEMARSCGIEMSECRAQRFGSRHHSFMTERFDRTDRGRRIHFASAIRTVRAIRREPATSNWPNGSSPTATIRTGTWSSSGAGLCSISRFRTATTICGTTGLYLRHRAGDYHRPMT